MIYEGKANYFKETYPEPEIVLSMKMISLMQQKIKAKKYIYQEIVKTNCRAINEVE